MDRYVLEMQVSAGENTALKGTNFRIQMSGLPGAVPDMPTAIRQLRYIAKTSTLRRIQNATPAEQEEMFKEFWKQRDPSPETEENELLQEYYYRIDRANQLFGSFREGWETDRGEVFIRFDLPTRLNVTPTSLINVPTKSGTTTICSGILCSWMRWAMATTDW